MMNALIQRLPILLLVAVVAMTVGCRTTGSTSDAQLDSAPSSAPGLLAPGDVIRVSFPGFSELGTQQTVQPDGTLNLPSIGRVRAAGRTLESLQGELKRRYAATVREAEAVVTVESTASVIYVSGAVNRPGRVPLNRPMTVFEAVMEAGGFAPGADTRRVRVIRRTESEHRGMTVDLGGALRRDVSSAAFVRAYDVIHVPEGIF